MTTATEHNTVRIVRDSNDHGGSRDWDNLGTMHCWHNGYNLGDVQHTERCAAWLCQYAADLVDADDPELIPDEHIKRILDKHVVMLPLYLFDHSGLTMKTTPFSCRWDSGQVGYIVCSLKEARENWMRPDATWDTELTDHNGETLTMREYTERILRGEVKTYDQELTGDVYGFVIEDADGEHVDSCWGFYGDDPVENGMMDHIGDAVTVEQVRAAFNNVESSY